VRRDVDTDALTAFLKEQNFNSILSRVEAKHGLESEDSNTAVPDKTEYELVQDTASLDKWLAAAVDAGYVAVETETTSLDATRAELVGVSRHR
jgi:DNA polymerase-1